VDGLVVSVRVLHPLVFKRSTVSGDWANGIRVEVTAGDREAFLGLSLNDLGTDTGEDVRLETAPGVLSLPTLCGTQDTGVEQLE